MTDRLPFGAADAVKNRFDHIKPSEDHKFVGLYTKADPVTEKGFEQLANKYLPKIDLDGDHNISRGEILRAEEKGTVPPELRSELMVLKNRFDFANDVATPGQDPFYKKDGISAADLRVIAKGLPAYKAPDHTLRDGLIMGTSCLVGGIGGGLAMGLPGTAFGCASGAGLSGYALSEFDNSKSERDKAFQNEISHMRRKSDVDIVRALLDH